MSGDFKRRDCPMCRAIHTREEVHSRRRAETLSVAELRPYWEGLFKEKPFFSYHRCTNCQLLYAPWFFDRHALASLYSQMAPNMDDLGAVPDASVGLRSWSTCSTI